MTLNKRVHTVTAAAGVLYLTLGSATFRINAAAQTASTAETKSAQDTVLGPTDLQSILPPSVFFKGQSAPLQERNANGIHFADGAYAFASLVDTSGYSSGVQEKYQAYLITETPLQFADHTLTAGAYGVGFIANNKFLVMDIGGHDLFTVDSTRDEALRHPTPLKIVQTPGGGGYRLYAGRAFVAFTRAK